MEYIVKNIVRDRPKEFTVHFIALHPRTLELAASAKVTIHEETAYLSELIVSPKHRGRGLGTIMQQHREHYAQAEHNIQVATLRVSSGSVKQDRYKRRGYSVAVYGIEKGVDFMKKILTPIRKPKRRKP